MTDVGTALKSLAADCRLTALVTNDLVPGAPAQGARPALGLAWLHVPHHRLVLSRHASRRTATLVKSSSAPCGTSTDLLVTGAGVERAPLVQKRTRPDD